MLRSYHKRHAVKRVAHHRVTVCVVRGTVTRRRACCTVCSCLARGVVSCRFVTGLIAVVDSNGTFSSRVTVSVMATDFS